MAEIQDKRQLDDLLTKAGRAIEGEAEVCDTTGARKGRLGTSRQGQLLLRPGMRSADPGFKDMGTVKGSS